MAGKTVKKGELPNRFLKFQKDCPEVFQAYERLGKAVQSAGPLDHKTVELVRLAIVVGARAGAPRTRWTLAAEPRASRERARNERRIISEPPGL